MVSRVQLVVLVALGALLGCGAASPPKTTEVDGKTAKVDGAAHRSFLWSYHGRYEPKHWGEHFCMCRGGRQSPIDLHKASATAESRGVQHVAAAPETLRNAKLHLRHVLNNGHAIQVGVDRVTTLQVAGKDYRLLQFHFHTPSEHTVDGKHYPMEAHFVHQGPGGRIAVVSALFTEGAENAWLKKLWADLPSHKGEVIAEDVTVPFPALLPQQRMSWTYDGSLTTPPCTEGVHWMVLAQPETASAAQLRHIRGIIGANARPVQSSKGRNVDQHRLR